MHDPLGPKNLEHAFGEIQKVLGHKAARRNGHTGKKRENKFCSICTKLFHHAAILADPELRPMPCPSCQSELDKGQIAIICPMDKRFAFVYADDLVGHGPIMQVSKEVMDAVEERAREQKSDG